MDTAILINARLDSKRLPRKHLLRAENKYLIQWLIDRVHNAFICEIRKETVSIIVTTGDEAFNSAFEQLKKCSVFYGSTHNIPFRHLQCAKQYEIENIISIDGDNILCSLEAMKSVYNALLNGKEYIKTTGLPLGMNVIGYKRPFLERSLLDNSDRQLETGWTRIFEEGKLYTIEIKGIEDKPYLRFTLDYDCDYEFFKRIISHFSEKIFTVSDSEVVDYVIKDRIFMMNRDVSEEYWQNFNKNMMKEDA